MLTDLGAYYVCSVAQLCLTLGDPMDHSPPGSSSHPASPQRALLGAAVVAAGLVGAASFVGVAGGILGPPVSRQVGSSLSRTGAFLARCPC